MKNICPQTTTALAGAAILAMAPLATAAQTTTPPADAQADSDSSLTDIVVTAQRRAESVQNIPAAVQVLGGESLTRSGVGNTLDMTQAVPSLVIGQSTGGVQVALRGIGTDATSYSIDSPVSFYIDGVYLSNPSSLSQDLADVERIEVLKGPQSTLYGRNSTGGAINIVTREPSSATQADFQISYGNYNAVNAKAYISGGSDKIAASLAATYDTRDGYIKNLQIGGTTGDRKSYGLRGKVKLGLGELWSLTLSGDYSRRDDHSGPLQTVTSQPLGALFGAPFTTNVNETYSEFKLGGVTVKDYGASAILRGDLGFANLTSITAYRYNSNFLRQDNDGTGLPMLVVTAFAPAKDLSEEITLTSNTNGAFSWIAGASYLWEERAFNPIGVIVGPPLAPGPVLSYIRGQVTTDAISLYAQGTLALTDQFSLTVGGRYSNEKKKLDFLRSEDATGATVLAADPDSVRFTDFSPKASIEFRPVKGHLLYVSYTEGFRSGAYNLADVASPGPLKPENVKAWEVGGKHELLDRHVLFNWSAFHYTLNNLFVQSANQNDPTSVVGLQNAASARSKGIDADLTVAVNRNFKITATAAYLDAKFHDFPAAAANIPNPETGGFGNITVIRDLSGNRSVRAPKFTATLSGLYTIPLEAGDVNLFASLYHNSGFYFSPENYANNAQKDYQLVNLRVEFTPRDSGVTISGWVNNLTNEKYKIYAVQTAFSNFAQYDIGRLYGATLRYRF